MKHTILLADDSVTIQKVVELTFLDEDVKVVSVGNGSDALAKLEEVRPDLVLADIHMPGADGYEVCATAGRVLPSVPVLLLVGTFEVFDPVRASDAGASGHMKKPFDSQELLRRVRELLASGKSVAAASAAAPAPAPTPSAAPSFEPPAWAAEAPAWEPETATSSAPPANAPAEEGSSWSFEPVSDAEDLSAATPTLEAAAPAAESWGSFATSRFETPRAAAAEPVEAEPEFEPIADPEPPSSITAVPVSAAAPAPVAAPAAAAAAASAAQLTLSDTDLERLARRVAELLSDRAVKEVAWEVVPDLAEVLLKARIRELEAAVE